MGQTFATLNSGSQGPSTYLPILDVRTETLRSCFAGPSAPSSPAPDAGQLWYDDANGILFQYDGSTWVEVGTAIQSDVDYNLNQITNARLENSASDPTPAAGNVGYIFVHTGAGKVKVVVDSSTLETVWSASNADLWSIPLPVRSWVKDAADPPADVVVGTTPQWHTWRFNDTDQRMHTQARLPRGFSEDASVVLRVHYLLNVAESASDVLAAVLDYKKLSLDSADAADGTSTQKTASGQSIGAEAGQYTYHTCDILLPHDDANNPLVGNDALALSWGLAAVASVTDALVFDAELLSPCGPLGPTEV